MLVLSLSNAYTVDIEQPHALCLLTFVVDKLMKTFFQAEIKDLHK